MQIATLVNAGVMWADADEPLVVLARRMLAHRMGLLPVRERGRLAGIVTERDVMAAIADGFAVTAPARAFMTADPAVAAPTNESADVALRMLELGVRHLIVVDHGRVVGMVSARDLLMLEVRPGGVPPVAPVPSQ